MTTGQRAELVDIRLLRLPLDVHQRATEHSDEVVREFQLVAIDPSTAPARLLGLAEELGRRYAEFTAAPTDDLVAALQAGRSEVDLVYRVPPEVAEAAVELNAALEQVDAYCEEGGMLTLATPHESRRYRRWFLCQFVDQVHGAAPVPWPEYEDRPLPSPGTR